MHGESAYGLWTLVILNSVIFIFFAFSFVKPKTKTDWRSLTAFSAFIVALFTEMYGFPLTIYFLSGWLAEKNPGVDFLAHENGHLLHTLFGFEGNAHFDPLHILSNVLIVLGFILLSSAWSVLHKAQQTRSLATEGWYARCREHPAGRQRSRPAAYECGRTGRARTAAADASRQSPPSARKYRRDR